MKPSHSNEADDSTRRLLKSWRVTAPLPPRFQEGVWQKIEAARPAAPPEFLWRRWFDHLAALALQPRLVASYITLLLLLGSVLGWTQARQESNRVREELSLRYVQTIDPYRTP